MGFIKKTITVTAGTTSANVLAGIVEALIQEPSVVTFKAAASGTGITAGEVSATMVSQTNRVFEDLSIDVISGGGIDESKATTVRFAAGIDQPLEQLDLKFKNTDGSNDATVDYQIETQPIG